MDLRGTDLVETPSEIVNFDKATPTTVGVVFDPNTPATTDVLYVSSVDASTWIYNGTSYITYSPVIPASTPFYLANTTIDAGKNKTAFIEHLGPIRATSLIGSGLNITGINAANLATGTVNVGRLGTGAVGSGDKYLADNNTWKTISAGGLTYFTEAQNTSAPNATVNVDSLTAIASTTNADISIVPKGTGAFQLAVPDSLSTGGNKRGTYAVDLQMFRSANTQVASGSSSVSLGASNTASGSNSTAIGQSVIASGSNSIAIGSGGSTASANTSIVLGYGSISNNTSSIAIGYGVTASGTYSTAIGGQSNTASGQYSFVGGYNSLASGLYGIAIGQSCTATNQSSTSMGLRCKATGENALAIGGYFYSDSTASGQNSIIVGFGTANQSFASVFGNGTSDGAYSTVIGYQGHTFGLTSKVSISTNVFTSAGDSQKGIARYGRRTTDATVSTLTSNNNPLVNSSTILGLQNQQMIRFKGSVTGKQSGSTNVAVWDIDGVIVRGANAAATTLTISNVNLVTNASGWGTPTLSADTTNGGLKIEVAGLSATNIQWLAILDTIENLYL
jgi:hypothetical protein